MPDAARWGRSPRFRVESSPHQPPLAAAPSVPVALAAHGRVGDLGPPVSLRVVSEVPVQVWGGRRCGLHVSGRPTDHWRLLCRVPRPPHRPTCPQGPAPGAPAECQPRSLPSRPAPGLGLGAVLGGKHSAAASDGAARWRLDGPRLVNGVGSFPVSPRARGEQSGERGPRSLAGPSLRLPG